MTWKIGKPARGGGFDKSAHLGHLLAFIEAKGEQVPKYKGEGTQLAAVCSYVVCLDELTVFADQTIYGEALAPRIVDADEEVVAGILGQSDAKPGRSPAWILADCTDEEEATVTQFLDKWAVKTPSGHIIVEQPPAAESTDDEKF